MSVQGTAGIGTAFVFAFEQDMSNESNITTVSITPQPSDPELKSTGVSPNTPCYPG